MDYCQYFYGISEADIKEVCLISPLRLGLSQSGDKDVVKSKSQGKLGMAYQCQGMTVIQTFIGSIFVADAVLSLRHSPVTSLFFVGSAGLSFPSKVLDLCSIVLPDQQLSLDSLSIVLGLESDPPISLTRPDPFLADQVRDRDKTQRQWIHSVKGASFASLILEEDYLSFFKDHQIQVLDMECASFYASATHIGKKAVGLMFISDIVQEKPFYSVSSALVEKKPEAVGYIFELIASFV